MGAVYVLWSGSVFISGRSTHHAVFAQTKVDSIGNKIIRVSSSPVRCVTAHVNEKGVK